MKTTEKLLILLFFLSVVSIQAQTPASAIRIKEMELREKGYGWSPSDNAWKAGMPLYRVLVESKEDIGIVIAKAYFYDRDKKIIGDPAKVNSYYRNDKIHGSSPNELSAKERMVINFNVPANVNPENIDRVLIVIGNTDYVKVAIKPPAPLEGFEFAEKEIYEKSKSSQKEEEGL